MSVLIKDMEMPVSCIDCPFMVSRENDDCILQSSEANAAFENWHDMKFWCPLIEIPSHGRLVDADKIGLTDLEIVMCDGDYKKALEMLLHKIDAAVVVPNYGADMRGENND